MTKRCSGIPKGATGIYRLDCPTSPRIYAEGERITALKRSYLGHCTVRNALGIENIIRDSELILDEQWSMYQVQLASVSPVEING
jgi:hypothetical protein